MRASLTKAWTPEQIAKLEKLIVEGATPLRAASALNRSIISVQGKARKLGRPFPPRNDVKRALLAKEAEALGS